MQMRSLVQQDHRDVWLNRFCRFKVLPIAPIRTTIHKNGLHGSAEGDDSADTA